VTNRLEPLQPAAWPPEMRAALAALVPAEPRHPLPPRSDDRPKGLNLLGLLAHHPELTKAFHVFAGHVLFTTTLTPRQRELLVLRVAAKRNAEYEWVQHKVLGADAGLSAEEIDRVAEGPGALGWSPFEAALVRAADELVDDACIGSDTYAALSEALDAQQLLDVIFTVGAYETLAMAMRTFEVELDADLAVWK
jgi:alkylhydroperoxidase family enzyme